MPRLSYLRDYPGSFSIHNRFEVALPLLGLMLFLLDDCCWEEWWAYFAGLKICAVGLPVECQLGLVLRHQPDY